MPQTASLGRLISPQRVDRLLILLSYLGSLWYQGLVFLRAVAAVSNELGIFIFFLYPGTSAVRVGIDCQTVKKWKHFCFDDTIPCHTQIVVTVFRITSSSAAPSRHKEGSRVRGENHEILRRSERSPCRFLYHE